MTRIERVPDNLGPTPGFATAGRAIAVGLAALRIGALIVLLSGSLHLSLAPGPATAQSTALQAAPIKDRHIGVSREGSNKLPRSESDQALVDGWPLYRTDRGQAAFNDAMATLEATEGAAPQPQAFKGCVGLACKIQLPALRRDGFIPPGRIWLSPTEYVLFVASPRNREGRSYRLRGARGMKYFVFHEFHNSSRNTDLYDTISSHKSSVFVPFYLSKQATDARGRNFVIVVQIAPHDVVSIHATNRGSAGPGIEVAKNAADPLEPLQALAGILVATMVKSAVPRLEVVNHHGSEGMPMLDAYERRLETIQSRTGVPTVELPFVPAHTLRVAKASASLAGLIQRRGMSPPISVAERSFLPPRPASNTQPAIASLPEPKLVGPIRLARRPTGQPANNTGR